MITAGIDCGAKNTKALVLADGLIAGRSLVATGHEPAEAAQRAYAMALRLASLAQSDVVRVVATGAGRKAVLFADADLTEVTADARGAVYLLPRARTIIDVGAEESRGIRCDAHGRVLDFALNEKCAAGTGTFVEAMARALEVKLEDFGPLSLQSTRVVPMNAQCAVFAESEVVSLVHSRVPKADIARAIHDAIASRVVSLVRRVGVAEEVVLTGGMGRNVGFLDALRRGLATEAFVPEMPEFVGAAGAALAAAE